MDRRPLKRRQSRNEQPASQCGIGHGGARAVTSILQMAQIRFAGVAGPSRHFAASRLAALLGRADLPSRSEFAELRPATRVLITGLAAWIGLVGAVTAIAVISVEMSTVSVPAWLSTRGSASKGGLTRAGASFENIVQRPLFSRNRQVVVAPEPASAPLPALPTLTLDQGITLKGVFVNEGFAKAFLLTTQNPVGVWVQVNEEINGWRVAAVLPDQVVLEGQNQKLVVPLNVSGR
jgi:hypothetical protein